MCFDCTQRDTIPSIRARENARQRNRMLRSSECVHKTFRDPKEAESVQPLVGLLLGVEREEKQRTEAYPRKTLQAQLICNYGCHNVHLIGKFKYVAFFNFILVSGLFQCQIYLNGGERESATVENTVQRCVLRGDIVPNDPLWVVSR